MTAINRPVPITRVPRSAARMRRAQRGQTLIIALAVLFALLILGAVFVTQIARNLAASARSRDTQSAQAFAEGGIQYCNDQLTSSQDGADWRPVPSGPIHTAVTGPDPNGFTDPDYQWISQGFTRISFPGGRALVRVTYDPRPDDPRSELIRIEAVGRSGDLGQGLDPTIFVQTGNAPQLRRELIAYKQIGLTDYLFYVTNKDKRAQEQFVGTPAIGASVPGTPNRGLDPAVIFGDPSVALHPDGTNNGEVVIGGGMRINGSLRIGGDTFFYFSPRGTTATGPNTSWEGLQVSGPISLLPTRDINNGNGTTDAVLNDNDLQAFVNLPYDPITASIGGQTPNPALAIRASTDPAFDTHQGLVRDGVNSADVNGFGRSIPRLDPPVWDTYVNGSGVLRYRALTRDSGYWINGSFNTGQRGYGTGIYIDNFADLQRETSAPGVSGGYSLRADWLNSGGTSSGNWFGPFYKAPGVLVELLGNKIRLTRNDGSAFLKPDGTPINGANGSGGNILEIPLADAARRQFKFPDGAAYVTITGRNLPTLAHDGDEPDPAGTANKPFGDKNSYGVNVVIMAEGNVRVKGVYGAITDPGIVDESQYNVDAPNDNQLKLGRVHLTIVSGGTAYIDGNIVKGDGFVSNNTIHLERASTCAILAKDYVCVNTTAFQAPRSENNVWRSTTPDLTDFYTEIGLTRPSIDTGFSFGVPVDSYQTGGNPSPLFLMVRHASQADNSGQGQAFINLMVNPANADNPNGQGSNALYPFNRPALPPETYALTDTLSEVAPNFQRIAFALRTPAGGPITPTFVATPGFDNIFRFQVDQNAAQLVSSAGTEDYLFGGAMVAPLDIRIEAVLYAQEKSFFVIPGYAFNPDPNDTLQNFQATGIRPSYTAQERSIVQQGGTATPEMQAKNAFPFHDQPMDVRITINGSVVQNYTASTGDQAAWLNRWGYIPTQYGGTNQNVTDDHLAGHDPLINNNNWVVNYNFAEDRTADYRSFQEKQQNITHGLRYVYDPALAMPYNRPTSIAIYASPATRAASALRAIQRPNIVDSNNNVILPGVKQILPAVPRLPVCPGLLFFGESDRPLVQ